MATNLKDGKAAKNTKGTHGGNRGGDQTKKPDDQRTQSSQAAGKDPHRGEKLEQE